jgi:hypothetical protein
MNLLLPEVEVGTNIRSDTQSHVTDCALSHNDRKTQMTRKKNIWRIIRIRITQLL